MAALRALLILLLWANFALGQNDNCEEELSQCKIQLEWLQEDIQNDIKTLKAEMIDRKMEHDLLEDSTFRLQDEISQVEANHSSDLKSVYNSMMDLQNEMAWNRIFIRANKDSIDNLHLSPLGEFLLSS